MKTVDRMNPIRAVGIIRHLAECREHSSNVTTLAAFCAAGSGGGVRLLPICYFHSRFKSTNVKFNCVGINHRPSTNDSSAEIRM